MWALQSFRISRGQLIRLEFESNTGTSLRAWRDVIHRAQSLAMGISTHCQECYPDLAFPPEARFLFAFPRATRILVAITQGASFLFADRPRMGEVQVAE